MFKSGVFVHFQYSSNADFFAFILTFEAYRMQEGHISPAFRVSLSVSGPKGPRKGRLTGTNDQELQSFPVSYKTASETFFPEQLRQGINFTSQYKLSFIRAVEKWLKFKKDCPEPVFMKPAGSVAPKDRMWHSCEISIIKYIARYVNLLPV